MRVGIMQPYFLPYIGYFQLISAVDIFIVYDNIKYTKKGWINRNRLLLNDADAIFTVPLKNDSDSLYICERYLSKNFNRDKLLNQFIGAYSPAPFFDEIYLLLERIIKFDNPNLFCFLYNSLQELLDYLDIGVELIISSEVPIDHTLTSEKKVIALSNAMKADTYINPIGGVSLYSWAHFRDSGLDLKFLKPNHIVYKQFNNSFIDSLSIIDLLMFNSPLIIKGWLNEFQLIPGQLNEVNRG